MQNTCTVWAPRLGLRCGTLVYIVARELTWTHEREGSGWPPGTFYSGAFCSALLGPHGGVKKQHLIEDGSHCPRINDGKPPRNNSNHQELTTPLEELTCNPLHNHQLVATTQRCRRWPLEGNFLWFTLCVYNQNSQNFVERSKMSEKCKKKFDPGSDLRFKPWLMGASAARQNFF